MMLELQYEDGRAERLTLSAPVLIGRAAHCDLRIANWRVAREHARLLQGPDGWIIEDLGGLAGTFVNGALRQEASGLLARLLKESAVAVPETVDRVSLCKSVLDEAVGLGALEPLLEDSSISEIMVNVTCSP